jgi:hypothetical protein
MVAEVGKNLEKYSKITCHMCSEKRKELGISVYSEHNLTKEIFQELLLPKDFQHLVNVVEFKNDDRKDNAETNFVKCANCCNTGFLFIERKTVKSKVIHIELVGKNPNVASYPLFSFPLAKNMHEDELVAKFDKIRKDFRELGMVDQDIEFRT